MVKGTENYNKIFVSNSLISYLRGSTNKQTVYPPLYINRPYKASVPT